MARVALPQSRVRRERRKRRVFIICIVVSCLLVVVGLLSWLSWAPFVRITTIEVNGTHTLATSSIAKEVQKNLQGTNFAIFPRDSIFLYSKSDILTSLTQAFGEIARADVHAKNFTTIEVTITERQPKALWCGVSAPDPTANPPCFLLDVDGVAYAAAINFSGDAYKRYYGAVGTTTYRQYITPEYFHSLSAIVDAMSQVEKTDGVVSAYVDDTNDAHVHFVSGFELIFALSDNGADVYQRFALALQSDPFKTHKLSDFQYLDLRFGDKLYYKLK